jgi:hypothetical protein
MAEQPKAPQSWWLTLPGILTGVGGVIVAITGLILALSQAGLFGDSDSATTPSSTAAAVASNPNAEPAPTSQFQSSVPGTDSQGFMDYPDARCHPGNPPAAMARTNLSAVVICRSGPGNYYYRGVRVSDGAGIELGNVVRSSGGFDVTNPTDGTRYQVSPYWLKIVQPDGQVHSESMIHYQTY